jgi:hypothetical protein
MTETCGFEILLLLINYKIIVCDGTFSLYEFVFLTFCTL